MRTKIVLFMAVCFTAAAVFAAYVDQSKKQAAVDTITVTNDQVQQRGSSGIQFNKGGKTQPSANPAQKLGSSGGGGYRGGYTITGSTAPAACHSTNTCTLCDASCMPGTVRTSVTYKEDGDCCQTQNLTTDCLSPQVKVNGVCKTPCTCPAGQTRTTVLYQEDGVCCTTGTGATCTSPKVSVNGVCKTPCKNICIIGDIRDPRVNYVEDGDCCINNSGPDLQLEQVALE